MFAQAFATLQAMTGSAAQADPGRDGRIAAFPGASLPLPGAALAAGNGAAGAAAPAFDFLAIPGMDVMSDAVDYWVDSTQRWVLFWDCLRRAGNAYLQDEDETERTDTVAESRTVAGLRVELLRADEDVRLDPAKRPVVVFDPRTGTEAGEGETNETVRQALYAGHYVYRATLAAGPAPDTEQLAEAEAAVMDDIAGRHPEAQARPCRIGRCADIPAVAALSLLAADAVDADLIDAVPSSYWSGLEPSSPFRDPGSLLGGQWMASLDRDLGAGRQDGGTRACAAFHTDPVDRLWTEPYGLYADIDTADRPYLERAARRDRLFKQRTQTSRFHVGGAGLAGATSAPGVLELDDGTPVDVRTSERSLLLYAADFGRPAAGALAARTVAEAFGSVAAIRRAGRTVVYATDRRTGQLAFLILPEHARASGARPPGTASTLGAVPPGLYELAVRRVPHPDAGGTPVQWDVETALVPRAFRDNPVFAEPAQDLPAARRAADASESLDWHYKFAVRPWVRLWPTPGLAAALRAFHPARAWRGALSDANIAMPAVKALAAMVREDRRPAARDNEFVYAERSLARRISTIFASCVTVRDQVLRTAYRVIFESPFWALFGR